MSEKMDWHARLRRAGALLEGHFLLSSGLHSPHYVQCARLLQHPAEAEAAGRAIVDRLAPEVGETPAASVSPAIGGLILGHEVGRAWGCRAIWAERDPAGELVFRRGFEIAPGERVVVVEDVVTTAGSVRELIALVERSGGEIAGVGMLVDRSGGHPGGGIGWKVPDAALVRLEGHQVAAERCPQCAAGTPFVRPGSRTVV